jgi:carbonic anhydrase/acetyltransferase-like protein (isoleucine patch superfamily)
MGMFFRTSEVKQAYTLLRAAARCNYIALAPRREIMGALKKNPALIKQISCCGNPLTSSIRDHFKIDKGMLRIVEAPRSCDMIAQEVGGKIAGPQASSEEHRFSGEEYLSALNAAAMYGQGHLTDVADLTAEKKTLAQQIIDVRRKWGGFENIQKMITAFFPFKKYIDSALRNEPADFTSIERYLTPDENSRKQFIERGRNLLTEQGGVEFVLLAGGEGTRLGSAGPKHLHPMGDFEVSPLSNNLKYFYHLAKEAGIKIKISLAVGPNTREEIQNWIRENDFLLENLDIKLVTQKSIPTFDETGKINLEMKDNKLNLSLVPPNHGEIMELVEPTSKYVFTIDGADFAIPLNIDSILELIGKMDTTRSEAGLIVFEDGQNKFGRVLFDRKLDKIVNIEGAETGKRLRMRLDSSGGPVGDPYKDLNNEDEVPADQRGRHFANTNYLCVSRDLYRTINLKENMANSGKGGMLPSFKLTKKTKKVYDLASKTEIEKPIIMLEKVSANQLADSASPGKFAVVYLGKGKDILPNKDQEALVKISGTLYEHFRQVLLEQKVQVSSDSRIWLTPAAERGNVRFGRDSNIKSTSEVLLSGANISVGDNFILNRGGALRIEAGKYEYSHDVSLGDNVSIGKNASLWIVNKGKGGNVVIGRNDGSGEPIGIRVKNNAELYIETDGTGTVIIDDGVVFGGAGMRVSIFAGVGQTIRIGKGTEIISARLEGNVEIGENNIIARDIKISGKGSIATGNNVKILVHSEVLSGANSPVVIGENSLIQAKIINSTVGKGSNIGEGSSGKLPVISYSSIGENSNVNGSETEIIASSIGERAIIGSLKEKTRLVKVDVGNDVIITDASLSGIKVASNTSVISWTARKLYKLKQALLG